jgi:hypothetical protein
MISGPARTIPLLVWKEALGIMLFEVFGLRFLKDLTARRKTLEPTISLFFLSIRLLFQETLLQEDRSYK